MNTPIVVVGSYVQDLSFTTNRFPAPGETIIGEFLTGPGGKGSNQAVAARRAGGDVCFVGAVGGDAFASVAKQFHENEGIHAKWLESKDVSSGAASIVVDASGQNQIVVALGANNELKSEEVSSRLPESAEIVVTQLETNPEATMETLKWGRSKGALTVLNPAPMREDFDANVLQECDVIIPNETEFVSLLKRIDPQKHALFTEEHLTGLSGDRLHAKCRLLGVKEVVLTLGKQGAFWSSEGEYQVFPAIEGIQAVDTTGAGDAFVGGFAAGWVLFEKDFGRAVDYGVVVSGLSVTKLGTAPAMPKQEDIVAFLET